MAGSKFFGAESVGEAKYEVSHVIGKGSYGTVCAARNKHTGEKVAIKHIDRVFADKADTVRIIRELRFLRVLKHPNIIGVVDVLLPQQRTTFVSTAHVFHRAGRTEPSRRRNGWQAGCVGLGYQKRVTCGASVAPEKQLECVKRTEANHLTVNSVAGAQDDIYIVFELLDTDLAHMIRSKTKYDETHRQWLIYQLLAGLKHVHGANVFHRDLKPGNVLLNADCALKICDFGLARANFPDQKHAVFWTDYVATRWYRAPELILLASQYSAAIDAW